MSPPTSLTRVCFVDFPLAVTWGPWRAEGQSQVGTKGSKRASRSPCHVSTCCSQHDFNCLKIFDLKNKNFMGSQSTVAPGRHSNTASRPRFPIKMSDWVCALMDTLALVWSHVIAFSRLCFFGHIQFYFSHSDRKENIYKVEFHFEHCMERKEDFVDSWMDRGYFITTVPLSIMIANYWLILLGHSVASSIIK